MTAPTRDAKPAVEIPLSVPNLDEREAHNLAECVRTGWVSTAGPFVTRFEAMLSEQFDGAHAVAVSSGTAALHLAAVLAGVGADDEVVVPAITFIATCNAVRYAGAYPVIIDVDPHHWQLNPDAVADFLSHACKRDRNGRVVNRATGRKIRAIMPVHILGHPFDLERLLELSAEYGLPLIEDAAEALGARYMGRLVGVQGLAGALSFNGNKIITTGGGGALLTRSRALYERALYLSMQAKDDPVRYVHGAIGFNYRMTNVAAALGCAQLEKLNSFLARKRQVAALYRAGLADIPGISFMKQAIWASSSEWLFTVLIDPNEFGCERETLMAELSSCGIQTRPLWEPMHRSKALAECYSHDVRVADRICADALSLPCSTGIRDVDVARVCASIRSIHEACRR